MRYCHKCGAKLVWLKDEPAGYNRKTGKRLADKSIYQCPNMSDQDAWFNQPHDYAEIFWVDKKGRQI